MTRISNDLFDQTGRLIQGFDYENQAWVKDGVYLDCGHKKDLLCGCYGRAHQGGRTTAPKTREKYTVHIEKTETRAQWVEVEASSEQEAATCAIEKCKEGKEFFRGDVYDTQYKPVGVERSEE